MNIKEINLLKTSSKNIIQFTKFIKILTDHGLDRFIPYKHQRILLKKIAETHLNKNTEKHNHIVIGPRQCGKTTIIAVYILWYMIFNPDKCIALISYKLNAAKEILRTIREIYANLPDFIKPVAIRNNNEILKFENHTYVMIAPACSNSIRGRTIDLMVIDETAYIKKRDFKDFIHSVFPTQCSRRDAQMILISTPSNIDNDFHEIWKSAKENRNSFIPTKIRWDCLPNRDEIWKEQMIRNYGQEFFDREYMAKFQGE